MVIYRNIALPTVNISTMEIVLNIGRILNFTRIMELLNQSTVFSARVLLESALIFHILVNGKLTDHELKFPQIQG